MLGSIIGAVGSLVGGSSAQKAAKAESDRQYDLARNTVKYRVEDANNAGVHPLYALGAPTMSSTSHVGGDGGISEASGRLGNAISSNYEKEMQQLNLDHKRAEIDKTRAMTADFVMQSKRNSNIARVDQKPTQDDKKDNYIVVGGKKIYLDPNWKDVEDYSQRWGEGADFIGPYIYHKDLQHTLKRQNKKKKKYYNIPRKSRDQGGTKYYNDRY